MKILLSNFPSMLEIKLEYILKLMINDGKQFIDWDRDYFDGEQVTYYYDKEKKSFYVQRIDTIVGSYITEKKLERSEIEEILSQIPLIEFRNQGFF